MADQVAITAGSGTAIACDDIGGVFYQRVKVTWGVDGTATDASASAPLPVVQTGTISTITTVTAVTAITNALPAGTNNIGDVDVLTLPALPAGTNAIGKLVANSGVDIGDVDVTSIVPGTAATNLGKARSAAAGASDVGVAIYGIRDDALSTLAEDEGEWTPNKYDSTGAQWVRVAATDVGSTTDSEDGSVADGQSSVALTIPLSYTWDGDNWTRIGASTFSSIDLDETEEDIKTSAGTLYGYSFSNLHATNKLYLRFYNATAANTTVGSTAILFMVVMPPASSGHVWFGEHGPSFSTALCAAATTGIGSTDTGAPGTNEVVLAAWFK